MLDTTLRVEPSFLTIENLPPPKPTVMDYREARRVTIKIKIHILPNKNLERAFLKSEK